MTDAERDALVERMARAMADADLWPGAWDGNMPDGYAMSDAEKNAWAHRARAALAIAEPVLRKAEMQRCLFAFATGWDTPLTVEGAASIARIAAAIRAGGAK